MLSIPGGNSEYTRRRGRRSFGGCYLGAVLRGARDQTQWGALQRAGSDRGEHVLQRQ